MQGCYGLALNGLDTSGGRLHVLAPDAPVLTVSVDRRDLPDPRPDFVLDDDRAILWLSDGTGWAEITRTDLRARLTVMEEYDLESLLHPMLSGTFAVTNRWLGRAVFHAAAVAFGGKAWVVMGDKGTGKSTLTADLALRGVEVFADDLSVIENGVVHAGPAFVDLRPDAAAALDVGRDLGVLGARPRARLDLPLTSDRTLPLAGWVTLAWGDEVTLEPVRVSDRLPVLMRNRAVLLAPKDPQELMYFMSLPMFTLTRPRDWNRQEDVASLLASSLS